MEDFLFVLRYRCKHQLIGLWKRHKHDMSNYILVKSNDPNQKQKEFKLRSNWKS